MVNEIAGMELLWTAEVFQHCGLLFSCLECYLPCLSISTFKGEKAKKRAAPIFCAFDAFKMHIIFIIMLAQSQWLSCPVRTVMALQKVSPPCVATDFCGKAHRSIFSLKTGAVPNSPYKCPAHFMELMKSCTDGIPLNKGFIHRAGFSAMYL